MAGEGTRPPGAGTPAIAENAPAAAKTSPAVAERVRSATKPHTTLTLSVIVVSWNVRALLAECLSSLYRQTLLPEEEIEVIVADNASSDGTQEMVRRRFPSATLIEHRENLGFARANNEVLSCCRGRFLLLLNPDTVVLDHALDRMVAVLQADPRIGVLGCRLLNSDGTFQRAAGGAFPSLRNVAWNYLFLNHLLPKRLAPSPRYLEGDPPGTFDLDWVSGAAMMCRRGAVGTAFFDEKFFMFGEDMDLCDRVRRAGFRVVYTSTATILHHGGKSMDLQESPSIHSMLIVCPREFYIMKNGRRWKWVYDLILITGCSLRSIFFALRGLAPGGARRMREARINFRHALIAVRVLLGRS